MDRQREILLSPIFIVGAPRSGTTWLQKLLLESELVCGGQESHFYSIFHAAFASVQKNNDSRAIGLSSYWSLQNFDEQMREVWVKTFLSLVERKKTAQVLIEKTPIHALFIDNIARFLPKAKFIHLIRDSRSVTASLIAASQSWGGHWAPSNTKPAALEWYRHVKYAKECETAKDASRYIEIHYEDLLENPLDILKTLYDFMGVSFDETKIKHAIDNQSFEKQKKQGAKLPGVDLNRNTEPEGFLRKGRSESWREDLTFIQQATIWFYTRKLMRLVGYNWNGRVNKNER